jgi:uncharacterized protein YfcZ (UPF0381/DUF406 family)
MTDGLPTPEAVKGEEAPKAETKEQRDRQAFKASQEKLAEATSDRKKPKNMTTPELFSGEEPEPEGETPAKAAEKEDPGDVAPAPEESAEVRKAREFLKLKTAAPDSQIDKLSAEEALEWQTSVAKNTSETDRVYRERAELQKELEALKDQAATKEEEPTRAVPASSVDLTEAKSQLSEQFGDSEAEVLIKVLEGLVSSRDERIGQLEETIHSAQETSAAQIERMQRDRLGEAIPQLKDSDDAWKVFRDAAEAKLSANGQEFSSPEELFTATAEALYGSDVFKPKEESPPTEVEDTKAQKAAATPTVTTKRKTPKKLTGEEAQWRAFQHLDKNPGDIRGAKRAQGIKI